MGDPAAKLEDFRPKKRLLVDDFLYWKSFYLGRRIMKRNDETFDFTFPKRNDYTAANFDRFGEAVDKGPR